jgi:dihydrofolate reductase
MRELILKMSMSLDGFVSDLEGANGWMFGSSPESRTWLAAALSDASLHIMGSRTFRDMSAWWPTSTDVFAGPMNRIPKAVFSRRGAALLEGLETTANLAEARARNGASQSAQRQPGAESWGQAHVASGELAAEIARLKAGDGRPVIAHGGFRFGASLAASGLVDRYLLMVHPVALGRGRPLFGDLAEPLALRLEDVRAFPGGVTAQTYRPA